MKFIGQIYRCLQSQSLGSHIEEQCQTAVNQMRELPDGSLVSCIRAICLGSFFLTFCLDFLKRSKQHDYTQEEENAGYHIERGDDVSDLCV